MGKNFIIRVAAGILLSVIILYFTVKALGGLNPALLLHADINWALAGLSAILFAGSVFVRAMVYPFGINRRIGIRRAFEIVVVGNAANMVLPLRAGEALRLALFPHGFSAARRAWLAAVPAAADMIAIFAISELALPVSGFHNPVIVKTLHIVSVAALAVILILTVLLYFISRHKAASRHFHRGSVLKMTAWVFLSWLVVLASIVVGLMAYGYAAAQAVVMSFAIFAATNIITLVPATPGGLGLFEYGVVLGMEGFGIAAFPAKEVGMLLHTIQYAGLLPLGLWLYLRGLRLRRGSRKAGK